MAVTVASDNGVSIVVAEGDSVAVNVAQSQQGGVNAYGGLGPTILVNGTVTGIVGTIGINPFVAGPNITITTAGGSITVSGKSSPVLSVQGKTGDVVLSAADFAAVAENHTHSTSQIAGLAGFVQSYGNVLSVQGKTGSVSLSASDLGAAPAIHTHSTTDISEFTTSVVASFPVASVQGKTGTVTLSYSDITTGRVISNLVRYGLPGSAENPLSLSVANQTNVPLVLSLPPDGSSGTAGLCFAPTFSLDQQYVASSRGTDSLIGDLEELNNELGSLQSRWPSVGWPSGRGIVSSTPLGLRTSSGFVHTLNGCTGTVSIVAGANVNVFASGTAITISASNNTNAVQSAIWPALILGG